MGIPHNKKSYVRAAAIRSMHYVRTKVGYRTLSCLQQHVTSAIPRREYLWETIDLYLINHQINGNVRIRSCQSLGIKRMISNWPDLASPQG